MLRRVDDGWEKDIFPKSEVFYRRIGRGWWCGEIVECDIAADFDGSTCAVWIGDPDKIAFCVTCVAQKATGFATGLEFGGMVSKYAHSACGPEGAEVGKVGSAVEPEGERSDAGWE